MMFFDGRAIKSVINIEKRIFILPRSDNYRQEVNLKVKNARIISPQKSA
jgi:hypothetical protein